MRFRVAAKMEGGVMTPALPRNALAPGRPLVEEHGTYNIASECCNPMTKANKIGRSSLRP